MSTITQHLKAEVPEVNADSTSTPVALKDERGYALLYTPTPDGDVEITVFH